MNLGQIPVADQIHNTQGYLCIFHVPQGTAEWHQGWKKNLCSGHRPGISTHPAVVPSQHHSCWRASTMVIGTLGTYSSVPAASASTHSLKEVQEMSDLWLYGLPKQKLSSETFLILSRLRSWLVKKSPCARPAPFWITQLRHCLTEPRSAAPLGQTWNNADEMSRTD